MKEMESLKFRHMELGQSFATEQTSKEISTLRIEIDAKIISLRSVIDQLTNSNDLTKLPEFIEKIQRLTSELQSAHHTLLNEMDVGESRKMFQALIDGGHDVEQIALADGSHFKLLSNKGGRLVISRVSSGNK